MRTKLGRILSDNVAGLSGNRKFGFLPVIEGSTATCDIEFKDYGGTTRYVSPIINDNTYAYVKDAVVVTGGASSGIVLGSGDTPATEEDYCLESKINGLDGTISTQSSHFDSDNNCYYSTFTITITNNLADSVIINEYGKLASLVTSATKGGLRTSLTCAFLIERVVLDTPLVIPAGESAVLAYRMNFPAIEDPE